MLAGVVGERARCVGIDPTLARVLYVLIAIFSAAFPGILVYVIRWLVVPEEDTFA